MRRHTGRRSNWLIPYGILIKTPHIYEIHICLLPQVSEAKQDLEDQLRIQTGKTRGKGKTQTGTKKTDKRNAAQHRLPFGTFFLPFFLCAP